MSLYSDVRKLRWSASAGCRRIVAGIGYGAGTIWAEKDKVKGITTAASLWATSAIGLTVGIGDFPLAITVTLIVFAILASKILFGRLGLEKREDTTS
jgi:putative Mg2+ transporter-C (MgtC) family protein